VLRRWVWSSIHVLNIGSILSISASWNLVTFVAVSGIADPAIFLILLALLTIECTIEGAKPCMRPFTDVPSPCSCLFTISNFTSNVTATLDFLATLLGVLVAGCLGIARSHKTQLRDHTKHTPAYCRRTRAEGKNRFGLYEEKSTYPANKQVSALSILPLKISTELLCLVSDYEKMLFPVY
ncbi:hypothetical protein Hamer_G006382, partial [Homarus americanus]